MRIATGVASDDNEGQGWTLVTRNRNRRHAGSTQEVAKKDGCIDLGAVIPCDLYSNILGFASHVDICVISEVSIAMKGAGREEQHRRDEGSGERLRVPCTYASVSAPFCMRRSVFSYAVCFGALLQPLQYTCIPRWHVLLGLLSHLVVGKISLSKYRSS